MKIKGFSGIILSLVLNVMIAGCNTTQSANPGPYLPTLIYATSTYAPSETFATETDSAPATQTAENAVIVDNTQVPQTENVPFFQPFQEVLQAILVPSSQSIELAPTIQNVPTETSQQLPAELVEAIESLPTVTPIPTITSTPNYVYPDGVVPLQINSDGSVANVLPTPLTNYAEKPPCDMNPLQYFRDYGSDALYDLADTRDGKICAYTVVDFCPANLETPYADWKLNKKLQAQLSTEGTENDVWIYGYNIISIAQEAGATLDGVEPDDLIVLPEDEIDGLKIMLVSNSCSDPEGRFVLKPTGVYYLLDFLKSKIQ